MIRPNSTFTINCGDGMKERAIVQDIRHTRYIIVTLVLLLFFVILVLLNIGIGSMKI